MATTKRAVLLTGGTGFLGSNLASALLDDGHEVIILKRSFSDTFRLQPIASRVSLYNLDQTPIEQAFEDFSIDIVVHCATNYGRNEAPPSELIEANLILPLKLLELGKRRGVSSFINTDTLLPKGVNAYSLSKNQFSEWLHHYSDAMSCVDVVIEHFYGPYDDASKFTARILQDLLHGAASIDLTPGEQKRAFVYISDVVEAFRKILHAIAFQGPGYHRFEVGSGSSFSVRHMVSLVKELSDNKTTKLKFGALPYRKNEPMDIKVDLSNLSGLGWRPRVSLREGLMKTIELERTKVAS